MDESGKFYEKFYNRTLRFLSYRPRSEKEIKDFLKRKKVNELLASKILKKLRELNFVNDEEFTKWWIEQRTGSRPRGLRLIKLELKQKGISEEMTTAIIHDSRFIIQKEEEFARKALEKKLKTWRRLSKEEFREKAVAFLLRRGFAFDTIKQAVDPDLIGVDEALEKRYNENKET